MIYNRANILFVAILVLFCAYGYAHNCTQPHEHPDVCGELCAPTCENPEPIGILCPHMICRWNSTGGCRCDHGYVRANNSTDCVLLEDCG